MCCDAVFDNDYKKKETEKKKITTPLYKIALHSVCNHLFLVNN
jgi:hypothetical protein